MLKCFKICANTDNIESNKNDFIVFDKRNIVSFINSSILLNTLYVILHMTYMTSPGIAFWALRYENDSARR